MAVIDEEKPKLGMPRPSTPGIPGMTVSEAPMTAADKKAFIRDAGPGNPSVPPGGSAEARGFRQGAVRPQAQSAPRLGVPSRIVRAAGPLGAAYSGLAEGTNVYDTAVAPTSTGLDVAQQVAEGSGRMAAAGLGAAGGAKVGAALGALGGPAAPVTVPLGALVGGGVGGVAGYFGAGKAMEAGRAMVGTDPRSAVDRVAPTAPTPMTPGAVAPQAAPAAQTPAGTTMPANGAGAGRGSPADPNRTDVDTTNLGFGAARDFSRELGAVPRDLPADLRSGVVHKTMDANGRPVYSGRDVGENAQMVDGMGRGFKGRGTVSTVPGMAPGEARAILDRPFDPRNAMNPAQRSQYDQEVKNAQGINAFNAGMNPRKTTIDDLLRSRLANSAAKRQATADQTEMARGVAGLAGRRQAESELNSESERGFQANTMAESQQLQTARSEYVTADTEEKRNAAAKKLMALQGKSEANPGYTVVPGEEYLAPDGLTKLRGPALVLDNRTGKVVDMSAQGRRGDAAQGPKGARPEKYEVGKTYTVGDRNVRVVGLDAQGQPQFEVVK